MSTKSVLHPVSVTRSDGVITTVWKKDTPFSKLRLRDAKAPAVAPVTRQGNPVDMALEFDAEDVSPNLPIPKWWKKFTTDTQAGQYPSTPELLDVIPSPIGDLAVVWVRISQEKNDTSAWDSGIDLNILMLKSMETGDKVGYLKASSITDESFARSFGDDEFTNFRYDSRYSGKHYEGLEFNSHVDPRHEGDPVPKDMDEFRRKMWLQASRNLSGSYSSRDLTESNIPADIEAVKSDLARYSEMLQPRIDDSRTYFSPEHRFIDFSRVDSDELLGKGFGTAMYVYTAKRLGIEGSVLRGSTSQTAYAKAVWSRFAENMPEHTGTIDLTWYDNIQTLPVLDFRP